MYEEERILEQVECTYLQVNKGGKGAVIWGNKLITLATVVQDKNHCKFKVGPIKTPKHQDDRL